MLRIFVAFASSFVFVSCGAQTQSSDSDLSSIGSSSMVVQCLRSTDIGRGMRVSDRLTLTIEKNSASVVRSLMYTSVDGTSHIKQSIQGSVNTVFDFNSISKESARLLLLSTSLKTTGGKAPGEKKLSSALVQYNQGEVKVSDSDGKLIFAVPNCRTKSSNIAGVKGLTANNN
ncbi:MAG: hypothetical protein RLZZ488_2134 [Pseudomonadota bacterium]